MRHNIVNESMVNEPKKKIRPKEEFYENHMNNAVAHYRKIAGHSDDEVLTEDMLKRPYLERTCCLKSIEPDELKSALLRK